MESQSWFYCDFSISNFPHCIYVSSVEKTSPEELREERKGEQRSFHHDRSPCETAAAPGGLGGGDEGHRRRERTGEVTAGCRQGRYCTNVYSTRDCTYTARIGWLYLYLGGPRYLSVLANDSRRVLDSRPAYPKL